MTETQNRKPKVIRGVTGVILGFLSASAWACPVCSSDTGKAVRAEVFGSDFTFNLLVTVLPFLIFAAIVATIFYGVPGPVRARKIIKR